MERILILALISLIVLVGCEKIIDDEMIDGVCVITKNEEGYHEVCYDEKTTSYFWNSIPQSGGELINESTFKIKESEAGTGSYRFLGKELIEENDTRRRKNNKINGISF